MINNNANNNLYNVLVLGNGFDLHLKLNSSFSAFFENAVLDYRKEFKINEKNLLFYLLYLKFYYKGNPSNTFFKTIYIDDPNWMDVEGFIKELATEPKMLDSIFNAMGHRNTGEIASLGTDPFVLLIGQFLSKLDLPSNRYDMETIKNLLADNLDDFENRFTKYIIEKIKDREQYSIKQESFVKHIINSIDIRYKGANLQIINFNYTNNMLKLYEEANVHGTIDGKIVIGYDSTEKPINKDDIFELSKDWRKISIDFNCPAFNNYIDSIIIYGHSLGEQDYPYFFELFDKCNLLDNQNINIYFCYSKWDNSKNCSKKINQYQMNISKILNAYERHHALSTGRNTIVTDLKIYDRLKFIEIKDNKEDLA